MPSHAGSGRDIQVYRDHVIQDSERQMARWVAWGVIGFFALGLTIASFS